MLAAKYQDPWRRILRNWLPWWISVSAACGSCSSMTPEGGSPAPGTALPDRAGAHAPAAPGLHAREAGVASPALDRLVIGAVRVLGGDSVEGVDDHVLHEQVVVTGSLPERAVDVV